MKLSEQIKELSSYATKLKRAYVSAYDRGEDDEGMRIEKEYASTRIKIIDLVNQEIQKRKSVPFSEIEKEVERMPKPIPRETGIRPLDFELVNEKDRKYQKVGGFPMGNFVQIAGTRGTGKTSILLKMLSGFSNYEPVSWFDFEIGKVGSVEKLKQFKYSNVNLLYYNGSRELDDIIDEIKLLYAEGVRHFVIDSNMKIRVSSAYSDVNKNSIVSDKFSELTSSLFINIYLINQVSQQSEKDGSLYLKGGNDAEYDADIILFIVKIRLLDDNKKLILDEAGQPKWDETKRYIKCTKNRPYDNRLFTALIDKSDIFTDFNIEYEGYES